MPLLRKIVFYIFALIYLIICPLIILRLLGFTRDPHTHRLVKTGIIYVSSNPPNAKVYLNGRPMVETTPMIIRDLPRGIYDLRMELDGYKPWENNVPVADNKASSVENILLLPEHWKVRTFNTDPVAKLVPVPEEDFLLFATDESVKNVWILRLGRDISDGQTDAPANPSNPAPLFPEESIYRDARAVRYYTMARSPFFILEINVDEKHKYLWIDPRDPQVLHIEDISDLLPGTPQKFYWEPNDEKNLFVFYPGWVNRLNVKEKAIYPNIPQREVPVERVLPAPPEVPQAEQAFWANNSNTVIFRMAKDVFLMDAKPFAFSRPRLTRVMHVQENTDVYFDEHSGKLYYIDDDSHLLSSVQILHHKPFIPKPIAETLRLKQLEE